MESFEERHAGCLEAQEYAVPQVVLHSLPFGDERCFVGMADVMNRAGKGTLITGRLRSIHRDSSRTAR